MLAQEEGFWIDAMVDAARARTEDPDDIDWDETFGSEDEVSDAGS